MITHVYLKLTYAEARALNRVLLSHSDSLASDRVRQKVGPRIRLVEKSRRRKRVSKGRKRKARSRSAVTS